MKRLVIMGLAVIAIAGCKKKTVEPPTREDKTAGRRAEKKDKISMEIPPPAMACPEEGGTLFFSARRGNVGLFRMNVDGSGVKNLRLGGGPAASWDGTNVAFTQFYNDTNRFEVASMEVATGKVIRLTKDKTRDSKNPAWSPDGSKIAFQVGPNNTPDIAVMNADGTGIRVLTLAAEADSSPTWSPDGKKIAFESMRTGTMGVYVMTADGSKMKRVTPEDERCGDPAWSPDGKHLAYVATYREDGWKRSLRVKQAGTGAWWTVVKDLDGLVSPSWSPKGGWLVYCATVDKKQDVYVADMCGKTVRKLTNGEGHHMSATWAK